MRIRDWRSDVCYDDLNGIEITSQSNQVEDDIEGVTLKVKEVNTTPTTVSIVRDDSAATKAVQDFVSAYNSLQVTIESLTSYDTTSNKGSALTGDSLTRKVQNEVRDVLNNSIPTGSIRPLSQPGLGTNPDPGKHTVKPAKQTKQH